MRTSTRTTLTLAALLALSPLPGRAQTAVSLSMGFGSLFSGVRLGIGVGVHRPGPLFFGTSLGLYHYSPWAASPYGIYSDNYDGWGMGYRGHRYALASSCFDPYWGWGSYWDPYGYGWSGGCGLWSYGYRTGWAGGWWRAYRHGTTILVSTYWRDPFSTPWGPFWSYDPWGWYWDGFWGRIAYGGWHGWDRGRWYGGRGYYGGYYGRGGRTAHRPAIGVPGYKEGPRTSTGRTAKPRPGAVAPVSPETPRTARPRATAPGRPGTRAGPATTPRRPERPSDRAQPTARPRSGGGYRAMPSARAGTVRPDPTVGGRTGAFSRRAQAAPARLARPSDRVRARAMAASAQRGVSAERRPPARTGAPLTRRVPSARSAAPAARAAPSAGRQPTRRAAPEVRMHQRRAAPSVRTAPTRSEPRVRSAPARSRAPAVRAQRRRSAAPSRPATRSRPTVRHRGGGGR